MAKEDKIQSAITQEQIDAAKQKHGEKNVRILELPTSDEGTEKIEVLAIVPSRRVVGESQRYVKTDPNRGDEILIKACILTRLDEVLADDGLFYAALNGIAELIPIRKATVKNV